jgi:hypothetical protein
VNILSTIASGLAGWLTYHDMLRNTPQHDESVLHPPIWELAKANGYKPAKEFPLPRRPGQIGGSKKVDVVLGSASRREYVILELKFKKTAYQMAGSLTADAKKIARIDATTINRTLDDYPDIDLPRCGDDWPIRRATLLVWRMGDIGNAMRQKHESPIIRDQFLVVLKKMTSTPDTVTPEQLAKAMQRNTPIQTVDCPEGYLRFASTRTANRYWVGILNRRSSWLTL